MVETQSAFLLYAFSNIVPRRPIAPCRLWQLGVLSKEDIGAKFFVHGLDELLEEDDHSMSLQVQLAAAQSTREERAPRGLVAATQPPPVTINQ